MVEIYCKLIINKRRSFDKVPTSLKEDVELRLNQLGFDINGNLIES